MWKWADINLQNVWYKHDEYTVYSCYSAQPKASFYSNQQVCSFFFKPTISTWIVCVFSSRQQSSSGYLMQTLWPQAPEVPHHVRVFHVGLGVTLLRVDEGWKLHSGQKTSVTCLTWDLINYGTQCRSFTSHTHQESIPDEENGGVVASQVPVALFSVKLDRKASWISHGVGWPRFTGWKKTHLSH